MTWVRLLVLAGAVFVFLAPLTRAADPPPPSADKKEPTDISYYRDVRRILQQRCQGCHQPAKPLGGMVMTDYAGLFKSGDHALPGVVAGQPAKSFIIEQVTSKDGGKTAAMPKNTDPIPPAETRPSASATPSTPTTRRSTTCRPSSRPSPTRRMARCSPWPATTKCCCTRPTAPDSPAG
jgi:mono/diheme cytochrome c family protein